MKRVQFYHINMQASLCVVQIQISIFPGPLGKSVVTKRGLTGFIFNVQICQPLSHVSVVTHGYLFCGCMEPLISYEILYQILYFFLNLNLYQ